MKPNLGDCWSDAEFMEWFNSRPEAVKEMIRLRPPNILYRVHDGDYPGRIYSYEENEDGTITMKVDIESPFFPRGVFGVRAEDMVPWEDDNNEERRWKVKQILAWLVIALIYGFFFWYGPYYLLTDINGMAAVIAVHVGIAVFLCVVAIGVWAVLCIIEAFER